MRMWGVKPELLCMQHLLGEHVEMHMFVGTIKRGISIDGYLENGLIDTDKIQERHDALAAEIERRGGNHKSPLEFEDPHNAQSINVDDNLKELARRCENCRRRQENEMRRRRSNSV